MSPHRFGFLAIALFAFAACGPGPSQTEDVIVIPVPDMEDDADMSPGSDQSTMTDMSEDMPKEDMPMVDPDDPDGDGVSKDVDNCPENKNPEQEDVDYDGVGDACDRYPFYHDPSAPDSVDAILDSENDISTPQAAQSLELKLPFVGQGVVLPPSDGESDIDNFSFYVEKPTAVMIRMEPLGFASQNLFLAGIIAGIELRNVGVTRILTAPEAGSSSMREVFLPAPGWYTIAVSDIRNYIESQPDTGNASWGYVLYASEIPLPEPTMISAPSPATPHPWTGRLNVFEVDTNNLKSLKLQHSVAMIGGENNLHSPALSVFDPDEKRMIAYSAVDQISENGDAVELSMVLGARQHDRLWVVEDYVQHNGEFTPTLVLGTDTPDLQFDPETAQEPVNERSDSLLWLGQNAAIRGMIDEPQPDDSGTLIPDRDVYLLNTVRGESLQLMVTPNAGGNLIPSVELGVAWSQNGRTGFVRTHSLTPEDDDNDPNIPRVLRYLIAQPEEGELAIRISQRGNSSGEDAVGGVAYGYQVAVGTYDPMPASIDALPGQVMATVDPGSIALVKFTAAEGDQLNIHIDDADLFAETRIISATDWAVYSESFSNSFNFRAPASGDYYIQVRDFSGDGSMEPVVVSVGKVAPTPFPALPGKANGILKDPGQEDYYALTLAPGLYDFRLRSDFSGNIALLDADTFERITTGSRSVSHRFEAEQKLIVKVSSYSDERDETKIYTLGIQSIMPVMLGSAPAMESGTVNDIPFQPWFQASVEAGKSYQIRYGSPSGAFFPSHRVVDAETLRYIDGGSGGSSRWRAERTGNVLISLYDSQMGGGADFDYTLNFTDFVPTMLEADKNVMGSLADVGGEALYRVDFNGPGALDIEVIPQGPWPLFFRVLSVDSLDEIRGDIFRDRFLFATSEYDAVVISVTSADPMATGPFDFSIRASMSLASGAGAEVEPNDAMAPQVISMLPAAISGNLTSGMDEVDAFSLNLSLGQRLWAQAAAAVGVSKYSLDHQIRLVDPMGMDLDVDRYSGEGFHPALENFLILEDGAFTLFSELPSTNGDVGGYTLYLSTVDPMSVAEVEPNNDLAGAQDIGVVEDIAVISAGVTSMDTVDTFSFEIKHKGAAFDISLHDAMPGHELRLFDAQGTELEASGAAIDGEMTPNIRTGIMAPGIYSIELRSMGVDSPSARLMLQTRR